MLLGHTSTSKSTVKPVYSGHCVRQPPLYYSHLVQAPIGKTPYIKHFFKAATSLLQPFMSGPWVTIIDRFHCTNATLIV